MAKTKKPKEYRIESFEDLCNTLTVENKDRLLKDLVTAFNGYIQTVDGVRKLHPEIDKVKNWQIAQYGFIWIDDGEHDCKGVVVETDNGIFKVNKDNE